jgi:hypothetical protein
LIAPPDVVTRFAQLQQRMDALKLYALVDGVQYRAQLGEPFTASEGYRSLFSGTIYEALAHAGPWLIDVKQVDSALVDTLAAMEQTAPAVSWLIAAQTLEGLAQLLQLNLETELPDGRTALLRFWDPRVLVTLAEVLEPTQRGTFFAHIHEWHLLHMGQRMWIGTQHAQA